MEPKVIFLLITLSFCFFKCSATNAIDRDFIESVLDAEECNRQILTIRRNFLLGLQFADAGIRFPRGLLIGNSVDLGNYHQCLAIEHHIEDMHIQGKYCSIRVPLDQNISLPFFDLYGEGSPLNPATLTLDEDSRKQIEENLLSTKWNPYLLEGTSLLEDYTDARTLPIENNPFAGTVLTLAVCIPKPCSTQQAITSLLFNVTQIGFDYSDSYCRLPGDKPWSGADTAAVVIFSIIGFFTVLSTCYDLCYRFVLKKDIKEVNHIYQSCSVYTNGQRLMTFASGPENLSCIDGIRAISMFWVIIGHSFGTEPHTANPRDSGMWIFSWKSIWVTLGNMAVDTFLALTGILIVYTSAGKMNGVTLLKNLHWFYLGRVVRIIPLLAVTVLLQASYFNHMTDGPVWHQVETQTNRCRTNWWATLLNIQNWLHPGEMCVAQSWYIAIDTQLYLISPLVLFWVLSGKKRTAAIALAASLIIILIGSGIYIFNLNVKSGLIVPSRPTRGDVYMQQYYFNTLSRASPFFVGLIFGYILHIYRKKKVQMSWVYGLLLWACAGVIVGGIAYFHNVILQFTWDNEFMDNFMNTFMRPTWAVAIGLVVFTCVHGYGGPVDWFLSLDVWRVPARLSYGMFLFHYSLMFSINATMIVPLYFTVGLSVFKFLSHAIVSIFASFVLTLLVEMPISALYRRLTLSVIQKKKAATAATEIQNSATANGSSKQIETKAENDAEGKEAEVPAITIK